MGNAYEIYALRYATMSPRTPNMNFLVPDPHETTALDLDYFVWLVRGGGRDILVGIFGYDRLLGGLGHDLFVAEWPADLANFPRRTGSPQLLNAWFLCDDSAGNAVFPGPRGIYPDRR